MSRAAPIRFGMTMDNVRAIEIKAEKKQDGIYTFRGVAYCVKDGRVTHWASRGEFKISCHGFLVSAGTFLGYDEKKALREFVKNP